MANVRALNSKKYNMSNHRFSELYHYCLQYNEWKKELSYRTDTLRSAVITGMPKCSSGDSGTETLAIRRVLLEQKCRMVEETAKEADAFLSPYILKAVTNEGVSYNYLKMMMDIPCGKDMYYDRRRRFFWLLDKKKGQEP